MGKITRGESNRKSRVEIAYPTKRKNSVRQRKVTKRPEALKKIIYEKFEGNILGLSPRQVRYYLETDLTDLRRKEYEKDSF